MEKNIIDYFKKVLMNKNGHLCMNSFTGHLAELSQKERKYVKKIGLEKLIARYPESFLVCDDEIYHIPEGDKKEGISPPKKGGGDHKQVMKGGLMVADKKSSVNLASAKDDPCTVCSDPIEIFAIGECRHPICFRCSTKLRVLCEDKNCPVCRQTLDLVVFSQNLLPIDEHKINEYIKDKKYGIAFENIKICEHKSALLRHICSKCPNMVFDSFSRLEAHARDKHQLFYCHICVRQCKIFTEERKTYTNSELKKHIEEGDDAGSARGGHPLCQFCDYRYLDKDELLRHLRLHHCSCIICDEVNEEQMNYQFYADKNSLLEHQREKHYPCEHPNCMDLDRIPVYRDEIDLQGHNLQKHSGQKSKLEKKAEQRINVPFMYERKRDMPKKILTAIPDPAGGIHITGFIARRIEKEYSFIERDDAPNQFEENVFFDLEACGLEPYDDIRKHFRNYDRVSAYALPVTNPNVKSKWRAQKVEKFDENMADEESIDLSMYLTKASSAKQPPEESLSEFPSLAAKIPVTSSIPTPLAGWSKLAQIKPVPVNQTFQSVPVKSPTSPSPKPAYETGYIHKNLTAKFGFIQKDKHMDAFFENVYFHIEAYQNGMQETFTKDLTKVLSIGEKVCYTLRTGPSFANVKAKYRALYVWKTCVNNIEGALDLNPITSGQFKIVAVKNQPKVKNKVKNSEKPVPTVQPVPGISSGKFEALTEMNRRLLNESSDFIELSPSQDSGASSEVFKVSQASSNAVEELNPINQNFGLLAANENDKVSGVANDMDANDDMLRSGNVTTSANKTVTMAQDDQSPTSPVKSGNNITDPVLTQLSKNHNHSNSVISGRHQSILAQVLTPVSNGTSDDEAIVQNSHTTSEIYSSENEDDDDDDDDDEDFDSESTEESDDDNMENMNPQLSVFMQTLAVCLKNERMYKILKQQISIEMMKKGKYITLFNLQFVEFKKQDNSVHIMFCNPQGEDNKVSRAEYVKLNGFYPLESSWFGELKASGMVTKVLKDLYHINDSCHYITVARNKNDKVSKVTVHYRPSQPN